MASEASRPSVRCAVAAVSAEAVAFRQCSSTLLHAITEPEVLVWNLYSAGIITEVSRDRILSKPTRLERNSVLLEVLGLKIRTTPQVYHQVLRLCSDPTLQSVGDTLRTAYGTDDFMTYSWMQLRGEVDK